MKAMGFLFLVFKMIDTLKWVIIWGIFPFIVDFKT